MTRSLPLIVAAIFLIVANSVEARHSGNSSSASGGRAVANAAPGKNAKGAASQAHGGTAQSHAPGTPTPASGVKNFGAHVPPSALTQGRGGASSMQLAALHKDTRADAGGIAVAPSQMPTGHGPHTASSAVPRCPAGQAMSPAPNSCNQPALAAHPRHRFSSVTCGLWCYNRGLGYGMNPGGMKEECEKWKNDPEAYQKCMAGKAQYTPVLPADGSRG
jgi:hypothetical protein